MAALQDVVRKVNQIAAEPDAADQTTAQAEAAELDRIKRQDAATESLVGRVFDLAAPVADVAGGTDDSFVVRVTVPMEPPDHIAATFRSLAAKAGERYDDKIAKARADARSANTDPARKAAQAGVESLTKSRDESVAKERRRFAEIRGTADLLLSGSYPRYAALRRGEALREVVRVTQVEVEPWGPVAEGVARGGIAVNTGRVRVVLEPVAGATPSAAEAAPALTTAPALPPVPTRKGELFRDP